MALSMDPRVNARRIIFRKLRDGPMWARSFQSLKGPLRDLVAEGLVRRIAPPGGRARNMVDLTDEGWNVAARGDF